MTKSAEELEGVAEVELGIVPYNTNPAVKYSSVNGEYEQILAFKKGVQYARTHELREAERKAWELAWELSTVGYYDFEPDGTTPSPLTAPEKALKAFDDYIREKTFDDYLKSREGK